jgi:chemotaxis methyl-accepting protein methylase
LVPCNYCASIHTHGWHPEHGSETEELRYAHCCDGPESYRISPFRQRHLALVDSRAENILGIDLRLTDLARASRARAAGERIQTSLKSELRAEWRTEKKKRRLEEEACLRAEREARRAEVKEMREELKKADKAALAAREGRNHVS